MWMQVNRETFCRQSGLAVRCSVHVDNVTYAKRFFVIAFVQNDHKQKIQHLCTMIIFMPLLFTKCIKKSFVVLLLPSNCSKLTPVSTWNCYLINGLKNSFDAGGVKAVTDGIFTLERSSHAYDRFFYKKDGSFHPSFNPAKCITNMSQPPGMLLNLIEAGGQKTRTTRCSGPDYSHTEHWS